MFEFLGGIFNAVTSVVKAVVSPVVEVAKGAVNLVAGTVGLAADIGVGLVKGATHLVSDVFTAVTKPVLELGKAAAAITKDIPIIGGVIGAVSTIASGVTKEVEMLGHHALMMVTQPVDHVAEIVKGMTSTAINLTEAKDVLDAVGIVVDGVRTTAGSVANTFEQYVCMHTNHDLDFFVTNPVDTVIGAAQQLVGGVPLIGGVLSTVVGLPKDVVDFTMNTVVKEYIAKPIFDGWQALNGLVFGKDTVKPVDPGVSGEHCPGEHDHPVKPPKPTKPTIPDQCGCNDGGTPDVHNHALVSQPAAPTYTVMPTSSGASLVQAMATMSATGGGVDMRPAQIAMLTTPTSLALVH